VARGRRDGRRRESTSLDEINIEESITIEVEQAHPSRGGFGKLALGRLPVVEHKSQPGGLGHVAETDRPPGRSRDSARGWFGGGDQPGETIDEDPGLDLLRRLQSVPESCRSL